jgi:plasmid stabilization system protein ParE
MSHRVVFSPEAGEQLANLYDYIAVAASPGIAARYTEAIVSYCESYRFIILTSEVGRAPA